MISSDIHTCNVNNCILCFTNYRGTSNSIRKDRGSVFLGIIKGATARNWSNVPIYLTSGTLIKRLS